LPQGASPAQKDMFRLVIAPTLISSPQLIMHFQVKDAYEVLRNPENRRVRTIHIHIHVILIIFQLYDQHGIWPPPTAHETDTQGNWQGPARDPSKLEAPPFRKPFPHHPFFDRPRKKDPFDFFAPPSSHSHFHRFTDPFVFFDQIFEDLHHAFSRVPFGDSFSDLDDDFFRRGFMSPTSMFRTESSPFGSPIGGNSNVNVSPRGRPSGGSKRISKNYSTSNVNGVTYTKVSRRDSEVSHANLLF
jgi:DnaJ homolog subfamily B member 6